MYIITHKIRPTFPTWSGFIVIFARTCTENEIRAWKHHRVFDSVHANLVNVLPMHA